MEISQSFSAANPSVDSQPYVVAVCVSPGGIPKRPLPVAYVATSGLVGDGHDHAKHIRSDRAISLIDEEILQQLVREGFPLVPGTTGDNLTVTGLHVQQLLPGTLLNIGEVVLRLEQPRKPCFVLDSIDPRLQQAIVGRCGYMASVVREGRIRPGTPVEVVEEKSRAAIVGTDSEGESGGIVPIIPN